jgi:hypothetical protein
MPSDEMWLAICEISELPGKHTFCDWEREAPNEAFAKVLTVCHILVKHPKEYQEATGKDPEAKAYEYREYVDAVKQLI